MTSIEDLAKDVKATRAMIDDAGAMLKDASRSALVELDNNTSRTLRRGHEELKHGGWGKLPADAVGPFSSDAFSSQSGEASLFTGTEVITEYSLDDEGTLLHIRWEVPWAGTNEYNCNLVGANSDFYETAGIIATGNKRVATRFAIGEKAAGNPVDNDWRTCGRCKTLFNSRDEGYCPGNVTSDVTLELPAGRGPVAGAKTRDVEVKTYGGHEAAGWKLGAPYLGVDGPSRISDWRKCASCKALFYNGWNKKGECPQSGHGHLTEQGGHDYILLFDIPPRQNQQNDWRLCDKCAVLFFWPQAADSACTAGGKHHPQEFSYVLNVVP